MLCCIGINPSTPLSPSRKLAVFDSWSRLAVHVAMDNTVVIEEISEFSFIVPTCNLEPSFALI